MQAVQAEQQASAGPRYSIIGSFGVFVGLGGVVAALTILYLGMREVMGVGGACASGQQAFEVAHPCPTGVALLIPAAIWGGLIFVGIYVWQTFRHGAPSLLALLWPALFLSLGWNFLYFGIHPPGGLAGVSAGWLVCAVLFGLMGGVPLVYALPATIRHFAGRPPHRKPVPSLLNAPLRPTWTTFQGLGQTAGTTQPGTAPTPWWPTVASPSTWPSPGSSPSPDVVSELERLATLHQSGELDDAQYEAAKQKVLGGGG